MLNFFNRLNFSGQIKALISFFILILLGFLSYYFMTIEEGFACIFFASFALTITNYLNVYIQNNFKFTDYFIENLHSIVIKVGSIMFSIGILLIYIKLQPIAEILIFSGFLHLFAFVILMIKKCNKDNEIK